jgi:hypothetical protein
VDAARIARRLRRARGERCRPLVKDPIALLSAEWLADTFGMQVIVLIRHPAAFTASLLRLDWRFDFANFASQPALLDHDLAPFAAEIEAAARHRLDPVAEAGLLWRCLYATVDRYRRERPDWLFLRHEDVSARPVDGFSSCRHQASPTLRRSPTRSTARRLPGNLVDARPGRCTRCCGTAEGDGQRWRPRMSPSNISALRSSVEDVSSGFCTEVEWRE